MAGTGKSRRGFASMDPARQREIASKGGRAAHEKGTAHEWSSDEARVAGQKGGIAVSRDRAHMAAIGREGGESRSRASRQAREQGGGFNANGDREMFRAVSREGGLGDRSGLNSSTGASSPNQSTNLSSQGSETRDLRDVRSGPGLPADGR
jgi:general stress protein YciG